MGVMQYGFSASRNRTFLRIDKLEEIQNALNILPVGTKTVKITKEDSLIDLFDHFVVEFEHDSFKDGSGLYMIYERNGKVLDGKIKEFHQLTEITIYDKEGNIIRHEKRPVEKTEKED